MQSFQVCHCCLKSQFSYNHSHFWPYHKSSVCPPKIKSRKSHCKPKHGGTHHFQNWICWLYLLPGFIQWRQESILTPSLIISSPVPELDPGNGYRCQRVKTKQQINPWCQLPGQITLYYNSFSLFIYSYGLKASSYIYFKTIFALCNTFKLYEEGNVQNVTTCF